MCLLMDAPQPIAKKPLFRFNAENARIFAAKSAERRRAKPVKYPELPQSPSLQPSDERLLLVQRQITLTRDTLEGKLEPKDRAQLLRALCGLLDRERILRGEPLPGSRKPAPEPRQRQVEQPMAPVPCVPQAPTCSVPASSGVSPNTTSVQPPDPACDI